MKIKTRQMKQLLKAISIKISDLERDSGKRIPENEELLAVYSLCYDLLTRTKAAEDILIVQPEDMKEPGFEDEMIMKCGIHSNQLADLAFAISTKQGTVDFRNLLLEIMSPYFQKDIAKSVGIRANTISEFVTAKKSMTIANYQAIINYCIKPKN